MITLQSAPVESGRGAVPRWLLSTSCRSSSEYIAIIIDPPQSLLCVSAALAPGGAGSTPSRGGACNVSRVLDIAGDAGCFSETPWCRTRQLRGTSSNEGHGRKRPRCPRRGGFQSGRALALRLDADGFFTRMRRRYDSGCKPSRRQGGGKHGPSECASARRLGCCSGTWSEPVVICRTEDARDMPAWPLKLPARPPPSRDADARGEGEGDPQQQEENALLSLDAGEMDSLKLEMRKASLTVRGGCCSGDGDGTGQGRDCRRRLPSGRARRTPCSGSCTRC